MTSSHLDIISINKQLLLMRYKDVEGLLKYADSKDQKLAEFVKFSKAMTIGYGSTHSAHESPRGVFTDLYHREAFESEKKGTKTLYNQMIKKIHEKLNKDGIEDPEFYLPISNIQIVKALIGSNFPFIFHDKEFSTEIAGKQIPLLKLKIDLRDLELERFSFVEILQKTPTINDAKPNIIYLVEEKDYLTAYWLNDDKLFNKAFAKDEVKEIIKKMPSDYSVDLDFIKMVKTQYGIHKRLSEEEINQMQLEKIERINQATASTRLLLGHHAQFPNKDLQQWIVGNGEMADFKSYFDDITDNKLDDELQKISEKYNPSPQTSQQIKNNILTLLNRHKKIMQEDPAIRLFKILIDGINLFEQKNDIINEQMRLSLSRLEYILKNAFNYNGEDRTFFLEFGFDEIILLNKLNNNESFENINQIIKDFIKNKYGFRSQTSTDENMVVGLGNSGIDILNQNIYLSVQEAMKHTNNDFIKIYYNKDLYYEAQLFLASFIVSQNFKGYQSIPSNISLTLEKSSLSATVTGYKNNEIMNIIICDFLSSIADKEKKHQDRLTEELIEHQLSLRKNKLENPLIVVIDTTINSFDDNYMMVLLERFKNEIETGALAVITTHSLNKYFHMGLDKMPAGLMAGFYNQKKFPLLASFHQKNQLTNYQNSDPTPQIISSILKNEDAFDCVINHHNNVKKNAAKIYHKIIYPELLKGLDEKTEISVYDPFANQFQISGFIALQASRNSISELGKLIALLFEDRAGYGYRNTTYSAIQPGNIIRITIGALENSAEIKAKMKILRSFINAVNTAEKEEGIFFVDSLHSILSSHISDVEKLKKDLAEQQESALSLNGFGLFDLEESEEQENSDSLFAPKSNTKDNKLRS